MSEPAAYVYVDLDGAARLAGKLWVRARGGRQSASFQHADEWLAFDESFSLEPALAVGQGSFHTPAGRAIFSALGDSAPDRWGRSLLARRERRAAEEEERPPRTLREIDYLLGVSDLTRQGALRFTEEEGGTFLAEGDGDGGPSPVPPLVDLRRLLNAAERVTADEETAEDLRLLMAPGSSLGGARPKASVRDVDGTLLIAKFPAETDEYDIVRWEAVALALARQAGIRTADWRLEDVEGAPVLLLKRFDRDGTRRHPFLSAMSMLEAWDGDVRSYVEIADAIRMHGARPADDLRSLWRRLVFNVLVSNTDDHLRNHGFLHAGKAGWKLSPAYDLNPVPVDLKPRILSTSIDLGEDRSASYPMALEVADHFGLQEPEAREIGREVATAVRDWRRSAEQLGVAPGEVRRLTSAFEHEDLELALE